MGERTIKVSSGTLIATSPSGAGMDVRFPSRVLTGDCEPRKSAFISLSFRRRRSTDTSPPLNHRPRSRFLFLSLVSLLSSVAVAKEDSLSQPTTTPTDENKTTTEHTTKSARARHLAVTSLRSCARPSVCAATLRSSICGASPSGGRIAANAAGQIGAQLLRLDHAKPEWGGRAGSNTAEQPHLPVA